MAEYDECTPKCLTRCKYIEISHQVTTTHISPTAIDKAVSDIRQIAEEPWMAESVILNMTFLQLYYATNMFRVHEHTQRFTIDSLISRVGGIMGLWAGMSLVTLCQLLVYLLYTIVSWVLLPPEKRE